MKYRELNEVFEHKKHGVLKVVHWDKDCSNCVFVWNSSDSCVKKKCGLGTDRADNEIVKFIRHDNA